MMNRLFIDTDIVLDLLSQRQPHYPFAARLFTLADRANVELYISSLCFNNLHYLLSKQHNKAASRRILAEFKLLVKVLSVDDKIITLALNSHFSDFEDAIQYFTAVENNVPILITRNIKDYKEADIPIMTAEVFLKGL